MDERIKLSNHNLDQLLIKNKRREQGDQGGGWRPRERGLGPLCAQPEEGGGRPRWWPTAGPRGGGLGLARVWPRERGRGDLGWGERKRREEEGRSGVSSCVASSPSQIAYVQKINS